MPLSKGFRISLLVIALLLTLLVLVPNLFNAREQEAYGKKERLESAKLNYASGKVGDSATIVPGSYFNRGAFHTTIFGELNRTIWNVPVKAPVLRINVPGNRLDTLEFSGSMQTIGIDVKDPNEKVWSIRSVKKDQSQALPSILKPTLLRSMIRDQGAALNPYGALVVPVLADAIGIHHTNPKLYIFPYNTALGRYNDRMAGRLVIMEEEADNSWQEAPEFRNATSLMDTQEMLAMRKKEKLPLDALLYARSRLFDLLISDWDRHEGNWKWALVEKENTRVFQPIPVDRDMAFYNYQEGGLTQVVLLLNNKFQSFSPEYKDVGGLMHQSKELDRAILKNIRLEELLDLVNKIQNGLEENQIHEAFLKYPPEVYALVGKQHEEVLKNRLEKLPEAAKKFYELLQNE